MQQGLSVQILFGLCGIPSCRYVAQPLQMIVEKKESDLWGDVWGFEEIWGERFQFLWPTLGKRNSGFSDLL